MGKEAQGKSLHDCAEQSKLAASGAWWATQQAPSLDSREEGLPRAALMSPPSPAAARPCSASGSWHLPDPAVFSALTVGS